jgi:lipopolysaccharide/colanic/teichoic acid biosynthesis glycosyltransferase
MSVGKRLFDVVAGAVLVVVTFPLVLVVALVCAIALRTSPFFLQDRVGRDGRRLRVLKIRTLPKDTPRYADKYQLQHLDVPAVAWAVRRSHIDELPQLLLVVTGGLSLVGPRPEMPSLHLGLPPTFAAARTSVLPGITGLWQIGDHAHKLIGEAPEYDLFYLRHRSMRLDLWILFMTVRHILLRHPPISLAELPDWARAVRDHSLDLSVRAVEVD